jgi:hypothetical protein
VEVNLLAFSAATHCLTGCGTGETLGLVLATWWAWGDVPSIALAVVLAFFFGYLLTIFFRVSLGVSLAIAFPPTFLVNRSLIARGRGHAAVHAHH